MHDLVIVALAVVVTGVICYFTYRPYMRMMERRNPRLWMYGILTGCEGVFFVTSLLDKHWGYAIIAAITAGWFGFWYWYTWKFLHPVDKTDS